MPTKTIPESCAKCGNLCACVCQIKKRHKRSCRYRISACLSMELACPHGFQACPVCDPCSCGIKVAGVR